MKKKSKTKTAMDYFTNFGIDKGQALYFLSDHMGQPQFHYLKARQPGKSESMVFFDEWNHMFTIDNIMSFELRIEKHKAYNGYTIGYYSLAGRKLDLCNNNTYTLADMTKPEFMEHVKKEFNAVAKTHDKVFFRTEEDAKEVVEWIEALKLAYKMKEELAQ